MIQLDKVKEHIESKKALNKCDACGGLSWLIPHEEDELTSSVTCEILIRSSKSNKDNANVKNNQKILLGGPVVLATVVVCKHCGHIRFFSSKMIQG